MLLESRSPGRTQALGRALGRLLRAGDFVALAGPLGSGKTCFAQGVLAGLGVPGPVRSPTFTLVHQHRGRWPVYHVDAYRLAGPGELQDLGPEEFFYGPGVVVLEWADQVAAWLPEDHLRVDLELPPENDADHRFIRLTAHGARYRRLLRRLTGTLDPC
ncbi:MAG: tRNA (adenosine(37)-N6)-threonylcarbamoyltransferase complex ATPase subunit type 1 TsaE [bacterium]|nr:tRNA (adenosine(37)-N6)-threonylcarbamoyltransferase complex ATPase subunit type 1 TsaE [bacterium]